MQRAAATKMTESLAFVLFSLGVLGIAIVVAVGMATEAGHPGTEWLSSWAVASLALAIAGAVTGSVAQAMAPGTVAPRAERMPAAIAPVTKAASVEAPRERSGQRPAISAFRAVPAPSALRASR